jgi:hypothetical protein
MKLDGDVRMIAGETPVMFSKVCELFIVELAYRSWVHTLENNRRTLQVSTVNIRGAILLMLFQGPTFMISLLIL